MVDGIGFTPAKRDRLREAYDNAMKAGSTWFTFEGFEFSVDYVKHLLEFLDNLFPEADHRDMEQQIAELTNLAIESGAMKFCLGEHNRNGRLYHLDVVIKEIDRGKLN